MKKLMAIILSLMLVSCAALAENALLEGTVVCVESVSITAPATGNILSASVTAGDYVQAGDTLFTLETTKVYAQQSGTVYLFGEEGDSAEMIADRYGAIAYLEAEWQYYISASTKNAYDTVGTVVHPGEMVYLRNYSDGRRTGIGLITAVSGTSYTVEVTSGTFVESESISIYRDADYNAESRIGRAALCRLDPYTYTGEGCIVKYYVNSGDAVQKGDVLFETLNCLYHGAAVSNAVSSTGNGVIASVNASVGGEVTEGAAIAVLYPDSGMRVEAYAMESDLMYISEGAAVQVELTNLGNGETVLSGVVEKISLLATESEETTEATYAVTVKLEDTQLLRYGMNVTVISEDMEEGN